MKKVIRLTESDLMRIVKRVINENKKFGSFDDEEWYDEDDKFARVDDMGDDFDDEEFNDFDSFSSKHGHDTRWFGKGDSGRKMFDIYKDKHSKPFKVRTRRGMDEQSLSSTVGNVLLGPLYSLLSGDDTWKKIISNTSPLFGVLSTNTGKQSLKALISTSPVGVIKNMSIAAASGDAKNFTQAFNQAERYAKTDVSQIKNAAFKDMKSFGKLLQQGGIK